MAQMTAIDTAGELTEQQSADAIRCLSIPLNGSTLLLPNTAVAEVTEFGEPTPLTNGPGWLLGLLRWRGISIPVLAMESLVATANIPSSGTPAKVVVCNTLNGNSKLPFIAMAASGIPRLTWVREEALDEGEKRETGDHSAVLRNVKMPDGEGIIPDLDLLEQMLLRLGI